MNLRPKIDSRMGRLKVIFTYWTILSKNTSLAVVFASKFA